MEPTDSEIDADLLPQEIPMWEDIAAWIKKATPEQMDALARFIDFELEPADMPIFENWISCHMRTNECKSNSGT